MHIPPFWRGRRNGVPARSRIALFRAVVRAAQSVEGYRHRLSTAGLHSLTSLNEVDDVERALLSVTPLPLGHYDSLFPERAPAFLRTPIEDESRSAFMLPYGEARSGLARCHPSLSPDPDLYSPQALAGATSDLFHLARALSGSPASNSEVDQAMVAFCGIDAGVLTDTQRESLWNRYQVPLFEHFVGTDGQVAASECEVHAGLHVRSDAAVVECVDGELVFTSLTDERSPALRVLSGFRCSIEREPCDCGRTEPRIVDLRRMHDLQPAAAAA